MEIQDKKVYVVRTRELYEDFMASAKEQGYSVVCEEYPYQNSPLCFKVTSKDNVVWSELDLYHRKLHDATSDLFYYDLVEWQNNFKTYNDLAFENLASEKRIEELEEDLEKQRIVIENHEDNIIKLEDRINELDSLNEEPSADNAIINVSKKEMGNRIKQLEALLNQAREERETYRLKMLCRDSLIDTLQENIENLEQIVDNMVIAETQNDYVYIVNEGIEVYAIYKYLDDAVAAADELNEDIYNPRQLHTISKYKLKEGNE